MLSGKIEILQFSLMQIQRQQKRADVGSGLGNLDSGETEDQRQDQDQGQKADTLSGRGQNAGGQGVADSLKQHIVEDDPAAKRQGDALCFESKGTDADDVRIIFPEDGHQVRREDKSYYCGCQ